MQTRRRTVLILLALLSVAVLLTWSLPGNVVARSLFQSSLATATPIPTDTPEPTATATEPLPTVTPTEPPTATEAPTEPPPTVAATQAIPTIASSPTPGPLPPATAEIGTEPTASPAEPPSFPGDAPTVSPQGDVPPPAQPLPQIEVQETLTPENLPAPAPGFLPAPTLTEPDALSPGDAPSLLPGPQPPLVAPAAPPLEPQSQADQTPSQVPSVAQLIDNGVIALSYVWLCCGGLGLIVVTLVLVWLIRRSRRSGRRVADADATET